MRCSLVTPFLVVLFASLATAQSPGAGQAGSTNVPPAASPFPIEIVRRQCIDFSGVKRGDEPWNIRDCRVSEFGEIGTVDKQTYYYAIYCLIPNYDVHNDKCGGDSFSASYFRQRGLAVFVRDPSSETARLLFERVSHEIGLYVYPEKPEIIRNAAGTLFYLPIALDGTGHFNASEYYLREMGQWERIEAEAWDNDLRQRIPPGLAIRKGVWPDLHTMQAEAALYREGDANCCASGGIARIRLSIRLRRFVITSFVVDTRP